MTYCNLTSYFLPSNLAPNSAKSDLSKKKNSSNPKVSKFHCKFEQRADQSKSWNLETDTKYKNSRINQKKVMARTISEKVRILETPGITSVYHEMKVNGFHLVERKLINSKTSDGTPKMAIITHSRFIDDSSYTTLDKVGD